MFILDWYQQLLAMRYEAHYRKIQLEQQSHVEEIPKICESCETLKMQLAMVNQQNEKLLARLMEKPESIPDRTTAPNLVALPPKNVPWRVRQQMLENEDKARAEAMKKAAKPDTEQEKKETEEFEKELEDAKRAREAQQTAG
jgi:hypothetical protein